MRDCCSTNPAAGRNRRRRVAIALIRRIRDKGIRSCDRTRHDNLVMGLVEEATVLDFARSSPRARRRPVQSDKAVVEAYLGVVEVTMELLELADSPCRTARPIRRAQERCRKTVEPGEIVTLHRRQRRRQDDDIEKTISGCLSPTRGTYCSTASRSSASPPISW